MKKKLLFTLTIHFLCVTFYAQISFLGNTSANPTFFVGWTVGVPNPLRVEHQGNQPIHYSTGGVRRHTTTIGAPLNNNIFSGANGNFSGDGISIAPGPGSSAFATLDLFTTVSNQTHIRMDGTALLQTASSRFEQYANLNGFWFNATGNNQFGTPNAFNPLYVFNIKSAEKGRLGSNEKWRFGNNPGAVNANNRVEISASAGDPYFATNNASGLRFTNLNSTKNVVANGVNGVNYQRVLSVDGNGDVVLIPSSAYGQ
jgi:hypothetical protein